jgi:hypothetical protein
MEEAMANTIQSGLPTVRSTLIGTIMEAAKTTMRAPTTKKTGLVSNIICGPPHQDAGPSSQFSPGIGGTHNRRLTSHVKA